MKALAAGCLIAALSGASGCRGCRASGGAPAPSSSAAAGEAPVIDDVPAIAAPVFAARPDAQGLSLPQGCAFDPPIRAAPAVGTSLRFIAGRSGLDSLVLGEVAEAGGAFAARGAVELTTATVDRNVPWSDPAAPPSFERSARGWVAATVVPEGASRRAWLWREHAQAVSLVAGDELRVADLACDGSACAVLTSLARATVLPGATLLTLDVGANAPALSRVDIEAGPEAAWTPLALPAFDGKAQSAWAILTKGDAAEIWRVEGGHAAKRRSDATPYGAYDAVATRHEPVVVAPGVPRDRPCSGAPFPLVFHGAGGAQHELLLTAPPTGVLVRPLSHGAIIAWIAPDNCRVALHTVVQAALIDDDGAPVASPMAVREANGFAIATSGDRVALWLGTPGGLVWIAGHCSVAAHDGGS